MAESDDDDDYTILTIHEASLLILLKIKHKHHALLHGNPISSWPLDWKWGRASKAPTMDVINNHLLSTNAAPPSPAAATGEGSDGEEGEGGSSAKEEKEAPSPFRHLRQSRMLMSPHLRPLKSAAAAVLLRVRPPPPPGEDILNSRLKAIMKKRMLWQKILNPRFSVPLPAAAAAVEAVPAGNAKESREAE